MRDIRREDLLDVLACEIDVRPPAPTIFDLAPRVRSVTRASGCIVVDFPGETQADVEAFAAAERLCCAGIGWEVTLTQGVALRISADVTVLDVLESMWTTTHIEDGQ